VDAANRSWAASTWRAARSTSSQVARPWSRSSGRRCALPAERRLDVQAGAQRPGGVAQPEDEVGDRDAGEAPALAQDVVQQVLVLADLLAVDAVGHAWSSIRHSSCQSMTGVPPSNRMGSQT
jgi:hypothetical protein